MKGLKISALILFAILLLLPVRATYASPVQDDLKLSIDKILDILRDPAYKGDENLEKRREALRSTIQAKFSFEKMSQLSLGKYWRDRSDEEKSSFVALFGQLLEDTYISKIEAYTDEKVVFVKELVRKNKAQINTKIITDSVEIPIDYRLYQAKDNTWMVYDMVIEGVSLVGNYRSQFDQMLQKDSYEKLVEELEKKIGKK